MPAEPNQPVKKLKRRWLQFSLRTMLVLLTVLCIWLAILANRARVQRDAVAAIRAAGAEVYYDFEFDSSIRTFSLNTGPSPFKSDAAPPGPAWLRELIGVDYLARAKWVTMWKPGLSDELAENISRLVDLDYVGLYANGGITDAGLRHLSRLNKLRFLAIFDGRSLTAGGLQHLCKLTGLEQLHLYKVPISSDGLAQFEHLANLEHLELSSTEVFITDADLGHLTRLTKLQSLALGNTQVTDRGLAHLEKLLKLRRLLLAGPNEVSDAGLEHLARLTNLQFLTIHDSGPQPPTLLLLGSYLYSGPVEIFETGFEEHPGGLKIVASDGGCFARRTEFERLRSGQMQITDLGLAYLKDLSQLRLLDLAGCRDLTDEGLQHLKGLTKLEHIDLRGSQVTAAGIATLQLSLPKVFVQIDPLAATLYR